MCSAKPWPTGLPVSLGASKQAAAALAVGHPSFDKASGLEALAMKTLHTTTKALAM